MIKINKLIPDICKHEPCFKRAIYEFIEAKKDEYPHVATLGHSCEHHVEEVNKMLKEIYNE
tara:strand:+ start:2836 stop:3018 length:183 start_codon:yes stop_codon:yes gene_type:complete